MDRLILHTVHTDDGATELYFGRAADDYANAASGSLLFHADDSVSYKMWTDAGEPVVVSIRRNRVVIFNGEDQAAQRELIDGGGVVFDSATMQ